MEIKKISSRDQDRVLLTEVLPYERPFRFSNDFFYQRVKRSSWIEFVAHFKSVGIKNSREFRPLNYKAAMDSMGKVRQLSIPHPMVQEKVVKFYKEYSPLIVSYSRQSPFSIRTQLNIARFKTELPETEEEVGDILPTSLVPRNYFKIGPYDLIAKYYRSRKFRDLELKFDNCLNLDIKKCFYSIYTHSIGWTYHGKGIGKSVRKNSLTSDFDDLMQDMNYGETAGIIVGPEVSRVFADVLLCGVDIALYNELEKKGYVQGRHYEGFRYVDDYSFYSNDQYVLMQVKMIVEELLADIRLYLNNSKTMISVRPFSGPSQSLSTIVRSKLKERVDAIWSIDEVGDEVKMRCGIRSRARWTSAVINEVRYTSNSSIDQYHIASSVAIETIYKEIQKLFKKIESSNLDESSPVNVLELLLSLLDIIFHFYKVIPKTSSTVKISKTIIQVLDLSTSCMFQDGSPLVSAIRRNGMTALDFLIDKNRTGEFNVNICTLITSLGHKEILKVDSHSISNFYKEYVNTDSADVYFVITSYIQNFSASVAANVDSIEIRKVVSKILLQKSDLKDSGRFMLFLDVLSCPFIDFDFKRRLCRKLEVFFNENHPGEYLFHSAITGFPFFYAWGDSVNLQRFAESMEWKSVY